MGIFTKEQAAKARYKWRKTIQDNLFFQMYCASIAKPPKAIVNALNSIAKEDLGELKFDFGKVDSPDIFDLGYRVGSILFSAKRIHFDNHDPLPSMKGEPAVIYLNHPSTIEPVYALGIMQPERPAIWGDRELIDINLFGDYTYDTLLGKTFEQTPMFARIFCEAMGHTFVPYIQAARDNYIPVLPGRNSTEILNKSVTFLSKGTKVLIMPEDPNIKIKYSKDKKDYYDPETGLRHFKSGIVNLADRLVTAHQNHLDKPRCFEDVPERVPFIGMALSGTSDPLFRPGIIGVRYTDPIYYEDFAEHDNPREAFKETLQEKLNDELAILTEKYGGDSIAAEDYRLFTKGA